MTERDFSISTGLAASTVTPGRTAPDASLAIPARVACENAGLARRRSAATTKDPVASARIDGLRSVHSPGVERGRSARRSLRQARLVNQVANFSAPVPVQVTVARLPRLSW